MSVRDMAANVAAGAGLTGLSWWLRGYSDRRKRKDQGNVQLQLSDREELNRIRREREERITALEKSVNELREKNEAEVRTLREENAALKQENADLREAVSALEEKVRKISGIQNRRVVRDRKKK
jgi:FtsZ-binding cell division protein ZapB